MGGIALLVIWTMGNSLKGIEVWRDLEGVVVVELLLLFLLFRGSKGGIGIGIDGKSVGI